MIEARAYGRLSSGRPLTEDELIAWVTQGTLPVDDQDDIEESE